MMQTVEGMENQAQEFIDYATKKGFTISQEFIDSVIAELRAVGLFRESISLKTYKMGLASAIDSGKIATPVQKPINIERAAEALQNTFPPVVKKVRKESSTDYVNSQSGRMSRQDRLDEDKRIENRTRATRETIEAQKLRLEYLDEIGRAETIRENTHAKTFAARAAKIKEIKENPKYASVRDSN